MSTTGRSGFYVRMSAAQIAALEEAAHERYMTRNALAEALIIEGLPRLAPPDQLRPTRYTTDQ